MASMMRSFIKDFNYPSWDEILPYVMAAYRRTEHQSTGCTPNLMMLGRETSIPLDLIIGAPPGETPCPIEWVQKVKDAQRKAHEFARVQLKKSAASQKRYYDRGREEVQFKEGDPVMYWYKPLARGALTRPWTGPVLIRKTWKGSHVYEIQGGVNHKPKIVHGDHLKLYEGTEVVLKPWWDVQVEAGQNGSDENESQVRAPPAVTEEGHSDQLGTSTEVGNGSNLRGPGVVTPKRDAPAPPPPSDAEPDVSRHEDTTGSHRVEEEEVQASGEKSSLELEPDNPGDPVWRVDRKRPGKGSKTTHQSKEKGEVMNVVDIHNLCGPYNPASKPEEQIGKAMAKMDKPGVTLVSSRPQRQRRTPDFYQAGF
jgi:hypothetical protein